jgi:hypothetical protein
MTAEFGQSGDLPDEIADGTGTTYDTLRGFLLVSFHVPRRPS